MPCEENFRLVLIILRTNRKRVPGLSLNLAWGSKQPTLVLFFQSQNMDHLHTWVAVAGWVRSPDEPDFRFYGRLDQVRKSQLA